MEEVLVKDVQYKKMKPELHIGDIVWIKPVKPPKVSLLTKQRILRLVKNIDKVQQMRTALTKRRKE